MDLVNAINSIKIQIKDYLGSKKAIIGISGGIDSAVVASLCVDSLGKDRVLGIQMPYGDQSTQDGNILVDHLGIESNTINIKHIVQSFPIPLLPSIEENNAINRLINGNVRARVRMTLLYALAGGRNGLVIGTSNRTEIEMGYFTKYGDGACDIEPIGDLYKTEIFEVAKLLGVPNSIVTKKPSAELWDGQTDEGEFGMTYKEIDEMLQTTCSLPEFYSRFGEEKVKKLFERTNSTEHKRVMPPTFKVR